MIQLNQLNVPGGPRFPPPKSAKMNSIPATLAYYYITHGPGGMMEGNIEKVTLNLRYKTEAIKRMGT
jgi:hypothetical protein